MNLQTWVNEKLSEKFDLIKLEIENKLNRKMSDSELIRFLITQEFEKINNQEKQVSNNQILDYLKEHNNDIYLELLKKYTVALNQNTRRFKDIDSEHLTWEGLRLNNGGVVRYEILLEDLLEDK